MKANLLCVLQPFHIDICQTARRYNMNSRIQYDILFTHVAKFVQTLPCGQRLFRALPQIAHRVFRDEQRAAQLGASIQSYHTKCQSEEPGMFLY
jgi:hypothetical protein